MRRLMLTTLMSLTWLLAGCCATTTEYVKVPVASCPAPPVFTMPESAVAMLPDEPYSTGDLTGDLDALKTIFKAIMYDHVVYRDTLQQCIQVLDSYRQ